jgi:hypothetical protein
MQDASTHARPYQQRWPAPSAPRPIVLIGAGGIVRDAHLPAYRAAGLPLQGVYDTDRARAEALAREFGIPRVYRSLDEAVAETPVVFDLALPPQAVLGTVEARLSSSRSRSAPRLPRPRRSAPRCALVGWRRP